MKPPYTKRKQFRTILPLVAALPAAAAAAFVYFRYRHDLTAAKARVSSGSKLVDTPCGPIEYADVGTGAPVLVIHGAGGGFDQGLEFARPLLDHGFRVIAPSRFGYLRTPLPKDKKDASPTAQADAHVCLLDALQLDRVAVVGVSAGAPSAMQLCLRHPERCTAMVLGVPLAYSPRLTGAASGKTSAFREFLINTTVSSDLVFWTMSKLAHDATIKTILGTPPEDLKGATADERARAEDLLAHIEPISKRKKGLQNDAAVARSLARYDLERFQVPTLVFSVETTSTVLTLALATRQSTLTAHGFSAIQQADTSSWDIKPRCGQKCKRF